MNHTAHLHHDPLDARQFELAVRRLANALSYGQESSPGRAVAQSCTCYIADLQSADAVNFHAP